MPVCLNSTDNTGLVIPSQEPVEDDFISVELIKDNLERTATDDDFLYEYAN